MDLEEDPDIALSVPLRPLYEEMCCPICFNRIEDCFMTPCGHNFCSECINECLNRKHVCPSCNTKCEISSIIKNHHFDRLALILQREKDTASAKYFDDLINARKSPERVRHSNFCQETTTLSPIEQCFHNHLKRSLSAYEEYYHDLTKKNMIAQQKLQEQYSSESRTKNTLEEKEQAERLFEQKVADLQNEFKETLSFLVEGYDKFLTEIMPDPTFLPLTVSFSVPERNLVFPKIILRPTDHLKDIKSKLEELLMKRGDHIVSFGDDCTILFKISAEEEPIPMIEPEKPLHSYSLPPYTQVLFMGSMKLKSDVPKECFATVFVKGKEQVVDYYTCRDCSQNWLCKSCAEYCHKGHNVSPYIIGHKPTWSCCYCSKKKCLLVKK